MRPIDDKIFVAWCVLGVHSTAISSSKACELLGIGINEWRSIDISIEGARRLLSENIVSGGLLETRDLISALQEYRRYHAISVFADDLSPMARELTRPRWLGKRIDLEPSLHRLAKDFGLYLVNVRRDGFNSVIGLIELPDHKYVSISAAGSGETRDDIDDDIYRKLRKKMAELKKS